MPITSRKMHRCLTNSPPPPGRQAPGAEPYRKRTRKGAPRAIEGWRRERTCERLFSFRLRPYVSSECPLVRADGPFEPNCFASPTYEGTRARQNALISSLFVPRHRPQRWTSNVMVTTGKRAERVPNRSSLRGGGGDIVLRGTVIRPMAFTPVE